MQFKFDENMMNIMTCIYMFMEIHVHTIVYIYRGKTCMKPVNFNISGSREELKVCTTLRRFQCLCFENPIPSHPTL